MDADERRNRSIEADDDGLGDHGRIDTADGFAKGERGADDCTILEVLAKGTRKRIVGQNAEARHTHRIPRSAPSCAERARTTELRATLTRTGGNYGHPDPPKKKKTKQKTQPIPPAPTLKLKEGNPSTLSRPVSNYVIKPHGVKVQPGAPRHLAQSLSAERWIPMDTRERMLRREFAETKLIFG